VADQLQELIDDRNRRRLKQRRAWTIKDEPAAGAREEAYDDRVLGKDVPLEYLGASP
jgi:hypothetical protein